MILEQPGKCPRGGMTLVAAGDQAAAGRGPWSLLTCCLDWRALTASATIALGVIIFRPDLFFTALPVLLVAICPLSMLLMAWQMRDRPGQSIAHGPEIESREAKLSQLELELADLSRQLRGPAPEANRPAPAERSRAGADSAHSGMSSQPLARCLAT